MLGLAGYYRKFIKSYTHLSGPIINLLQKGAFSWNQEAQQAFEQLKHALSSAPVLTFPDFNKAFEVETDASHSGIGAVLT